MGGNTTHMTDKTEKTEVRSDLDAVLEAGKMLMESGAEIYRIEQTMGHMASALEIEDFDAYVVNRGIIASGTDRTGTEQAKVVSLSETSVDLGRIEAVNALSREILQQESVTAEEITDRLRRIREAPAAPLWMVMTAYFLGAGCFSYAIGSPWADALASAVAGLVMGLMLHWVRRFVRTNVLLMIIGSAVVTVIANLLFQTGLGEHRGLIILGALMLIVPGAAFTDSVREFSQNNYSTGLTLLMGALLTCLSISVGVALTTEILPFAEQMTSVFSSPLGSFPVVLVRILLAGTGTMAFAFLFHAPNRYALDLGFLGSLSWMLYLLMKYLPHMEIAAIFVPALFVALASRVLAVRRKCPVTIFLSTSIFPLIPGLSFYRAVYFLLTGSNELAMIYMRSSFISAFTIAVAIIIAQQIPLGTISRILGKRTGSGNKDS